MPNFLQSILSFIKQKQKMKHVIIKHNQTQRVSKRSVGILRNANEGKMHTDVIVHLEMHLRSFHITL